MFDLTEHNKIIIDLQLSHEQELQELRNEFDVWHKKAKSQALAGQKYKLLTWIKHDASEALLALDRPTPNIEMAISRLKQILEFCNEKLL